MLRLLKFANKARLHQGTGGHLRKCSFHSQGTGNCGPAASLEKDLAKFGLEKFQKKEVINGFRVDEVSKVDELLLVAVRLTHLRSGAQYLHIAKDDSNNTFSIGFRTTPMDSTGVPHILEHTVLCGSEKYPCKDPFFNMLKRSLSTFMNAMTGPDYTMYPFSTQNLADYRNLQGVYLDAVFKPLLRELDFKQEGWRLEHTNINDRSSPIIFKGVVFNEMKGVYSDSMNIFQEQLTRSLLPSHTYAVKSGGDPLVIPTLNYNDFLNFHKTHYHPSNSRFYSYGNFPLEDHLKFVDEKYLSTSDKIDTSSSEVPSEKRWNEPRNHHITCIPDPMAADPSRQGNIAFGYLINDIRDIQTSFEMLVVTHLLLRDARSEFYKSLVETKLGVDFGRMTGYDPSYRDAVFALNLVGVKSDDFDKIEKVFVETLQKIVEKGFEKEQLEAILHKIELQTKHQTSNFGLKVLFNVTPLWNHNGDLIQSLRINAAVQQLREKLKNNPKYLQDLVEKNLLNNPHKVTLTMLPDEKYVVNRELAEQEMLASKLKNLTKEDLETIYTDGQTLKKHQERRDGIETLPTMKLDDIRKDIDRYKLTEVVTAGAPLQIATEPTNGIAYYTGVINTQNLPEDLKALLPLFTNIVTKMGTQKNDYQMFDRLIRLKTGGISFSNLVGQHKDDVSKWEEGLLFQTYCLDRNADDTWSLMTELFNELNLTDLDRFEILVKATAADLVDGIAYSGHHYAMSSAASLVSPCSKVKDILSGLDSVERMKKLAQLSDFKPLLNQMQEIADCVLNKRHLRSAINLCSDEKDNILKGLHRFHESLKGTSEDAYVFTDSECFEPQNASIHYVFPYAVNYASKAILTVPYTHPDYAPLRVLALLLSQMYLHEEIREKGGAYGGGARLTTDGVFTFYSYRDPNSSRTFDQFDAAYERLHKLELKDQQLTESKLSIFQRLDAPVLPRERGMNKFIYHLTDDDIQTQREQIKAVTWDQIFDVAEKYLNPDRKDIAVGRALLGPANHDLLARHTENWIVQNYEEQSQARAAE